jgi:predicted Fe-S protein YdhL (DUF1289 family)
MIKNKVKRAQSLADVNKWLETTPNYSERKLLNELINITAHNEINEELNQYRTFRQMFDTSRYDAIKEREKEYFIQLQVLDKNRNCDGKERTLNELINYSKMDKTASNYENLKVSAKEKLQKYTFVSHADDLHNAIYAREELRNQNAEEFNTRPFNECLDQTIKYEIPQRSKIGFV